jgi:RNA polymerase sigma-70 factor (ECF subfamily)
MTDIAERLYERVLVLRCQAGDEAAFEEVIDRYSPRLRYYLRKVLGEVHGAEDILQDTWFDVFQKVPGLIDPGAFAAWIYRIARDRAFRELRKRKRCSRPIEDTELADPSGNEAALLMENAETVHAALDQLAPEHREVLVLRFLEDMSYEDITRVTGCQLGTVKSRLHYAKCALRRALERTTQHE